MEIFRLGERIDGGELPFAQNARWLHVFVDQPFDGKYKLIMKRQCGPLRQAADI